MLMAAETPQYHQTTLRYKHVETDLADDFIL